MKTRCFDLRFLSLEGTGEGVRQISWVFPPIVPSSLPSCPQLPAASFRGSLSLSADVGCTKKKDLLRPPLVVVSTRAAEDKNVVRDIDVRREEYLELCDRRNRGLSDKKTNPHEYAHVRLLGG